MVCPNCDAANETGRTSCSECGGRSREVRADVDLAFALLEVATAMAAEPGAANG